VEVVEAVAVEVAVAMAATRLDRNTMPNIVYYYCSYYIIIYYRRVGV